MKKWELILWVKKVKRKERNTSHALQWVSKCMMSSYNCLLTVLMNVVVY